MFWNKKNKITIIGIDSSNSIQCNDVVKKLKKKGFKDIIVIPNMVDVYQIKEE